MHEDTESPLLHPTEAPAARVLNARGHAPAVLVCEHASRFIPAALGGLGLDEAAARSHAAWDIGALELSVELMGALDAPLVHSRVSRLAYDCNRPPSRDDAMPKTSEVFAVPGNMGLTEDQRSQRIREVYYPFRHLLASTLDARPIPPVLITIHSFTPVYQGQSRSVELGILHDDDDRAAEVMLRHAQGSGLKVARNEPYSAADGVTHTLREHAIKRGLPNVMIEVRNDLINTPTGINDISGRLTPILQAVVSEFSNVEAKL
ncbi:N-formylglutamate amidohydrolase [Ruegeria sp. EL01]|jgi:predicted N-formylglutamate amidohydrolase|uniref:N-formylglutamate amidohydrolase n=1 Tax=Ruegeria sp. EL01 TaxID=2107578 RepID=UPI000EA7F734|nr:N-formylglutamate amidohydrolase [Ruegeria sp. EL01]